jgi:DNA primase
MNEREIIRANMIQTAKQNLDLVSVVEASGVEVKRYGARHVGLCPFHDEKTPSFFIFDNNRFKCFGCGAHGDSIDFIQKLYGLSFQDALKHLGIEKGEITPEIRLAIAERKRRSELVKQFRKWELHYCIHISDLHFRTKKLMMNGIPSEDLDLYATLFHKLPVWEHHINILIHGSDKEKHKLYQEAQKWKNKNLT